MNKSTTCCFTGNRSQKLPWGFDEHSPRCVAFKERLCIAIQHTIDRGYRHFICGMALGIDVMAFELCVDFRSRYAALGITVEAALPCQNQSAKWRPADQLRHAKLCAVADKVTVLSAAYTDTCMMDRNKYMVDCSSLVIAVSSGSPGGTEKTIAYAKSIGVEVVLLVP